MLKNKHKLLELKTKALVDSLFVWNYKTKLKWRWIEFADYKEYDISDDVKNIDFVRSAKEWKTLVKLYEEERELSVYVLFDLDENFYYEINWTKKIDLVYEFFYMIWLSAIKSWDKLWALIYNNINNKLFHAKKWKQNFINITNNIDNVKYIKELSFFQNFKNIFNKKKNKNINKWLKYFNSLKIKNSLVFLLTDKLDKDLKDLKIAWVKNDLIVCNIFNSFENELNSKWLQWFDYNGESIFIDLDSKKKDEYVLLRKKKLDSFKKKVLKCWARYLYIDEKVNIYKKLSILFKI